MAEIQWPFNADFRNKDGSWDLQWYRFFTLLSSAVNSSQDEVAIDLGSIGGGSIGGGDSVALESAFSAAAITQTSPPDIPWFDPSIPQPAPPALDLITTPPAGVPVPRILQGTHAARANYSASAYPDGSLYRETDRLVYYVANGANWEYSYGTYADTLSNIPTLGAHDVGFLFEVTDYGHVLQWTGTVWQRGPGDLEHSDTFHMFGAAPTDAGWHSCDGSSVTYLKYDGTTASRTLPNTAGTPAYPRMNSAYNATITAATVPVFTGNAATPTGTVSQPTFTGTPNVSSGSVSSTFTGTPQTFTTLPAAAVGVVNAFTAPNPYTPAGSVASTFTGGAFTPGGTVSQPTFTGNAATPTGTISLPADPIAYFQVLCYYRR